MNTDERLLSLRDRWQAAKARGEDCLPEDVCRDDPELLPELKRQIEVLGRFDQLQATNAAATGHPHPVLTETLPDPRDTGAMPPAASPLSQPAVGDVFGNFRILALLGAGGMGRVYKACEVPLGR